MPRTGGGFLLNEDFSRFLFEVRLLFNGFSQLGGLENMTRTRFAAMASASFICCFVVAHGLLAKKNPSFVLQNVRKKLSNLFFQKQVLF